MIQVAEPGMQSEVRAVEEPEAERLCRLAVVHRCNPGLALIADHLQIPAGTVLQRGRRTQVLLIWRAGKLEGHDVTTRRQDIYGVGKGILELSRVIWTDDEVDRTRFLELCDLAEAAVIDRDVAVLGREDDLVASM